MSATGAAIEFAMQNNDWDFLRCWNEGDFDAIRREWPEAPAAVFVGAEVVVKDKPENKECWSSDQETFYTGSLGDLLDMNTDLEVGDVVYKAEAMPPNVYEFVEANISHLMENLGEYAYDFAGEWVGDWPELNKEQKVSLATLITGWLEENCPPTFFSAENAKPYTITQEDVS